IVVDPIADVVLVGVGELVSEDLLHLQLQEEELDVLVESVRPVLGDELCHPLAGVQQVLQASAPLDLGEVSDASTRSAQLVCGHPPSWGDGARTGPYAGPWHGAPERST